MQNRIIVAGQGGQGALRIGQMIAYAGMNQGKETSWLPSYGAEMRGGTANCSVIVSDEIIASPIISKPNYCLLLNKPSVVKFESWVESGGALLVNSSMAAEVTRKDVAVYKIPADGMAEEEGNPKGANMVMLGAYLAVSKEIPLEAIYEIIEASFTGKKAKFAPANKKLVLRGYEWVKQQGQEAQDE